MEYPEIYHDNRLDDGTPAASSTATGDFDVLNLRDWRAYTFWKPNALPATVTVDCASPTAADYALLMGHNCGTNGNTIQIRGSTDNFSASDVLVATSTPTTDDPLLIKFSPTSYRYWRYRIVNGTAPSIAIAAIGAAFQIPAGLDSGFDPIGREAMGVFNRSVDGHALGTITRFTQWKETLRFSLVSWSWMRSSWLTAWEDHLRGEPSAFAWSPTSYPTEIFLIDPIRKYRGPHKPGQLADLEFEASGVA